MGFSGGVIFASYCVCGGHCKCLGERKLELNIFKVSFQPRASVDSRSIVYLVNDRRRFGFLNPVKLGVYGYLEVLKGA